MEFIKTKLEGCYIIEPKVFKDERGHFFESFNQKQFEKNTNLSINFVQDNVSKSTYGVLRGLHFQDGAHAQAKLVSVSKGKVLDVAVDLRKNSKTFGQAVQVVLSAKNKKQMFIPRGFAHGFVVLSKEAVFSYKCDNFYNKTSEKGINYKDLGIDWLVDEKDICVNERDNNLPFLKDYKVK
ncbi:MAG: dTDP-4-dehydrorhamnose 3,5-epimerase [Winogradskyella sp.]